MQHEQSLDRQTQSDLPQPLPYAPPPAPRPVWVRVGLFGLRSRTSAWAFFWLCVIIAAASAIRGFSDPVWFWGVGMALAAWWYRACIRWVDTHDRWA